MATLVVGVLIGAALRGPVGSSSSSSASRPKGSEDRAEAAEDEVDAAEPAGPGPYSSVSGVGVGFEHSEAGAVAAAVSYATASQSWLYLDDNELDEAVSAVVAPSVDDQIVTTVTDDVSVLRDQLRDAEGTVWFVVAPLATKLDSFSASRAVVRVWVVRALSADGVAVPQSGWQTLTLDLGWYEDWKVVDVTETEGPTPQLEAGLQPWAAGYLDETLEGFVRVGIQ